MQQQPLQPNEVTRLLREARGGDRAAVDELFSVVYEELRRLSQRQMRQQKANHTLQPTALVNEVYVRIANQEELDLRDRTHFFSLAARIMRQVLVDHARRRDAAKRGGNWLKVTLEKALSPAKEAEIDLLALDAALAELEGFDERKSRVVELRFFAGLSMQEVAQALDVSLRTIENDWYMARAWLRDRLDPD